MRILLLSTTLILSACSSVPQRAPAVADVPYFHDATIALSAQQIEKIAQALVPVFQKYVVTLERPIDTYHYEKAKPDYKIENFADVNRLAFSFANSTDKVLLPEGLDVAVDPKASIDYGWDDPWLFVIEIKPGVRLLSDFSDPDSADLEKIKMAIAPLKLKSDSQQGIINQILNITTDAASNYRIMGRLNDLLGLSGEVYPWYTSELPNCRNHSAAVDISDPKAISVVAFYAHDLKFEKRPLAASVLKLFNEADYSVNKKYSLPLSIAKAAADAPVSDSDYSKWKTQSTFGCGPLWNLEKVVRESWPL